MSLLHSHIEVEHIAYWRVGDVAAAQRQAADLHAAFLLLNVDAVVVNRMRGVSVMVPDSTTDIQRRDARLLAYWNPTPNWLRLVDLALTGQPLY